ncbi:Uncharacterised protein [Kingella potus]|uniref:DUF4349 domain-containing protein n=2 Tax=Kingella potus TaxID=265175 RepID=A0A377R4V6_9NEIS|nr:DUF4349 domain-containing protein [Kingella potus]STR03012.1 Uncharacterised protein [Kingella potus]
MNIRPPVSLLLSAALLAACGAQEQDAESGQSEAPVAAYALPAAEKGGQESSARADSIILSQKPEGRQMVVEADISFKTKDSRQTLSELEKLALKYGGFVEKSRIEAETESERTYPQQDGTLLVVRRYGQYGSMTVRLPKEKTADFLRDIQPFVVFLENQSFAAADVALDIRRQALEAARQHSLAERLQQAASSAEKSSKSGTAEVLVRQSEARAEAEYARLQQAYWQDKVAFATLNLRFFQPESVFRYTRPDSDAEARQYAPSFWQSAGVMLKQGWAGFVRLSLLLAALWPLWLFSALFVVFWRIVRKRSIRKKV